MGKKNQNAARQTRQGVRDLSTVGSRVSRGRRMDEPPVEAFLGPGYDDRDMPSQRDALDWLEDNRNETRQRR